MDDSVECEPDCYSSNDEDGLEDEATGYDDGLVSTAADADGEDETSALLSPSPEPQGKPSN